jgi:NodT family efflux transporter outer membrane factor (OMF) lipoprotein
LKYISILSLLALTGCMVGPNYKRPDVPAPPQYRFDPSSEASAKSLADAKWPELFEDQALDGLVKEALTGNFDLNIAAERVVEARNTEGVRRSFLYPEIDGGAQFNAIRNSENGTFKYPPSAAGWSYTQPGFTLSWELDVWGRLRRLTEAARAQYLASEEARRAVVTTLVADVTSSYLGLRELDAELEIALKTKDIATDGLRLTTLRHERGAVTGLDVHQSEQFLFTATAQIASTERQIGQMENQISLLLGRNPGVVARGKTLEDLTAPAQVPPGLPSALLERRPDIRQAEDNLIAANAQIGAARAQYFPQITLNGFLGLQSWALTSVLDGSNRQLSVVPAASAPIFTAGRTRATVRIAEAQQREALIGYQKTVRTAFREVSDSLEGYRKTVEQRTQEELLVKALRETVRLSTLRYKGGLDSFLQVLDAERNLFQGELALVQLRREELLNVVQLYRALGGGWR